MPASFLPTTDCIDRRRRLEALRVRVGRLEASGHAAPVVMPATPLGEAAIDAALPGGGLRLAALHEIAGLAASGFTAALAGRVSRVRCGLAVWCQHRRRVHDEGRLYGPGLARFGWDTERLVVVDGDDDTEVLWAMEEALRSPAVAVAVAEVERVDLFATRRLQLAAEAGGGAGLLLRSVAPAIEPSAALTRWQVRPLSSATSVCPANTLAPLAWRALLWRAKGAVPNRFEVCFDEPTLRFALVADLAHGSFPARDTARV